MYLDPRRGPIRKLSGSLAGGLLAALAMGMARGEPGPVSPIAGETRIEAPRRVTSLAMSRDGTRLATVVGRRGLAVYDAADGRRLRSFPDAEGAIHSLDVSASGRYVAIGGAARTVEHEGPPWSEAPRVVFKAEGETFRSGLGRGIAEGPTLKTLSLGRARMPIVNRRRWSEDVGGALTVRDLRTGAVRTSVDRLPEPVYAVHFREDEAGLTTVDRVFGYATVDLDGRRTPAVDYHLPIGASDFPCPQTSFSGDGSRLVSLEPTVMDRGEIHLKLVRPADRHVLFVAPVGESDPWAAVIAPDGTSFASGGVGGTVKLWDFAKSEVVRIFAAPTNQTITFVAFDPEGKWVLACDLDGGLFVWEAKSGRRVALSRVSKGGVRAVAFGKGFVTVVSGGFQEDADPVKIPLLIQRIDVRGVMKGE